MSTNIFGTAKRNGNGNGVKAFFINPEQDLIIKEALKVCAFFSLTTYVCGEGVSALKILYVKIKKKMHFKLKHGWMEVSIGVMFVCYC